MKSIFIGALAVGLSLAAYIYLVAFDNFSETELINMSLLWLLPFVFGLFGLLAPKYYNMPPEQRRVRLLTLGTGMNLGIVGVILSLVLLLPLRVMKGKPLAVATTAAVYYVGLSWVFFNVIFPEL